MKPSLRIQEIKKKREAGQRIPSSLVYQMYINTIMEYLDEEYERNKPCEHKDSYQVDGVGEVFYNVCNDCGVLFLAKE